MSSVLQWQMDIHDRLATGLPHTHIYLEGVPEGTTVPRDPTGLISPLVILWFGQLTNIPSSRVVTQDLCGTEISQSPVKIGSVLIQMVAPTGLALLQLENVVRGLLTGFRPAGEGELEEEGSATIRDPFPAGIGDTLRIYKPLYFSGVVTVGAVAQGA